MLQFLIYAKIFYLFLGLVQALVCQEGWNITYIEQGDLPFNTSLMKESACPTDYPQHCIRGEAILTFVDGPRRLVGAGYAGSCGNDFACNEPCEDFARQQYSKLAEELEQLNITMLQGPETVTFCKKACCDVDNCNNRTVDEIVAMYPTTALVTPTQSTPGGGSETVHHSQRAFFVCLSLVTSLIAFM